MGAIERQQEKLKYILDHYCKVSDQSINYHTSNIQFSIGVEKCVKTDITGILKFKVRELLVFIYDVLILKNDAQERVSLELDQD